MIESECRRLQQEDARLREEFDQSALLLRTAEESYAEKLAAANAAEIEIESARTELLSQTAIAERLREIAGSSRPRWSACHSKLKVWRAKGIAPPASTRNESSKPSAFHVSSAMPVRVSRLQPNAKSRSMPSCVVMKLSAIPKRS